MELKVVFDKEHWGGGYTIAHIKDDLYTIMQKLHHTENAVFLSREDLEQILKNEEVK